MKTLTDPPGTPDGIAGAPAPGIVDACALGGCAAVADDLAL